MKLIALAATVVAATLALTPQRASAQSLGASKTDGFFLGIGAEANNITTMPGTVSTLNPSGGGGIVIGYGITERWALYVHSGISTYANTGGTRDWAGSAGIGARYHFLTRDSRWRPFVQGGFSQRTLASDRVVGSTVNRLFSPSVAGALGGGLDVHFTRGVAVSTSALFTSARGGMPSPILHLGFLFYPNFAAKAKAPSTPGSSPH